MSAIRVPYVIDNQSHRLVDILGALPREHQGRSLDVATAYFTVGGFGLIKDGLIGLGNFRLLLGAEPTTGQQLGLRPDSTVKPPRVITSGSYDVSIHSRAKSRRPTDVPYYQSCSSER